MKNKLELNTGELVVILILVMKPRSLNPMGWKRQVRMLRNKPATSMFRMLATSVDFAEVFGLVDCEARFHQRLVQAVPWQVLRNRRKSSKMDRAPLYSSYTGSCLHHARYPVGE